MKKTKVFKYLFLCALIQSVFASENKTVDQLLGKGNKAKKSYSINLDTVFQSNLFPVSNSVDNQISNTTSAIFRQNFNESYTFVSSLSVDKNLRGERKLLLRDPLLQIRKSHGAIAKNLTLQTRYNLFLPLSNLSRENQDRIARFDFSTVFGYNASETITPGLYLSYRPSVSYRLNKFTRQTSGAANFRYSITNSLITAYQINDQFSLALTSIYSRFWTEANDTTDNFVFDQSIFYQFSPIVSFYLGHSIGGSALALNGQDSDVRLFDSENSTFYFGIGYTY